MNAHCLDYRLAEEERRQFEAEGYFVVPGAVDGGRVAEHVAATDTLYTAFGPAGGREVQRGRMTRSGRTLNLFDAVGRDQRFVELLDWPQARGSRRRPSAGQRVAGAQRRGPARGAR